MLSFSAGLNTLVLVLLLADPRAEGKNGDAAFSVPIGLHAEVVAVAYGERHCDAQCEGQLASRLRAHGPIASLCAAALQGLTEWPSLHHSWLDIFRSHLPIFHLLVRAGRIIEEDADDEWADIWQRLLPQAKGWLSNLRWPPRAPVPGFMHFLKTVRRWPSQKMQVELLLLAANALSVGVHHITMDKGEISPKHLVKAVDHFVHLAHISASNMTTTTNPYTPRLLGLLRHHEMRRIRSFEFIARFLPAQPVIVFAGANNGVVLREVLEAWPEGDVHAFEPDPFIFPVLYEHFSGTSGCRANHAALHSRDGQILNLRTRDGMGSQSTVFEPSEGDYQMTWPSIYESLQQGSTHAVKALALSPYFRRVGVRSLDFIYLDVECSELNALRGAREMLRNVTVLHLEVQNVQLCNGGALWPQVQHFLRTRGFQPLILPPRPWHVQMDVVLVRDPLPSILVA